MIRIFCDACGEEIVPKEDASKRFVFEKGRVTVELLVAVDKVWNAGQICERCMMDTILTGEIRTKS